MYAKAKSYLFDNYKDIMSLFSTIYTQIESEHEELNNFQKTAISAYYTVVSHRILKNNPLVSKIEKQLSLNADAVLTELDNELATAIVTVSRINDLEKAGYVKVEISDEQTLKVTLTKKGRKRSEQIGKDIRQCEDFEV